MTIVGAGSQVLFPPLPEHRFEQQSAFFVHAAFGSRQIFGVAVGVALGVAVGVAVGVPVGVATRSTLTASAITLLPTGVAASLKCTTKVPPEI
jgi:hypothetical protein